MTCANTHCYFCGKKLNRVQREKFADGYPYGAHDQCARINDAEEENNYYRQTMRALLGDSWRSYTLEDCRQMRMQKLGHEAATISRLVELCAGYFDGRARAELTVFGDGTCEVHLEHVAEVSDDGYDHQRTKILVALPQTTYPVTYTGLDEMLADLELAEWMDGHSQTPQGARAELDAARSRLAAAEAERDDLREENQRLRADLDRSEYRVEQAVTPLLERLALFGELDLEEIDAALVLGDDDESRVQLKIIRKLRAMTDESEE